MKSSCLSAFRAPPGRFRGLIRHAGSSPCSGVALRLSSCSLTQSSCHKVVRGFTAFSVMSKQDAQLSADLSAWRQRGQSHPVGSSAEGHSNFSAARGHGGSGQMPPTPRTYGPGAAGREGTAGKDSQISGKARVEPWWFISNCQRLGLGSDTPGQHLCLGEAHPEK